MIHSQFRTYTVPHKPMPLMFSGTELAKYNVRHCSNE